MGRPKKYGSAGERRSIHFDPAVLEKAAAICGMEGVSRSDLVNRAVNFYWQEKTKKA